MSSFLAHFISGGGTILAGFGFIRDKLEIKFLILYIAARVIEPIPFDTVLDLTMCDDGIDYFDFSECLADLVRTEHLTLSEDGLYAITEKGKRNGGICESSLPYSVRVKCDKNVARLNGQLRRDAQVRAERILRDDGTYTLRLALDDEHGNLLTLELLAATEQQANRLADQFKTHPEQVYNGVLDVLLTDFDEKE